MSGQMIVTRILLTGASLAALASPALAQEVPDPNQEIVVTAQKREQAIQDVPIAVSAFTEEGLQNQGLDGGYELVQAIPNVSFSKGNFTGYNFQIRGVGAKVVAGGGDAGVGVHLNNAPLTANRLFEADFYDVQRVEVLRGPQGTLFGRNATGGVVNVITRLPEAEASASVRGEFANYNTVRLTGIVNVPIIGDGDTLALRVAATTLQRDGFGRNNVTGGDIDDRDIWAARATLAFNPTDNIRAWLLYEHFEEDDSRVRVGKQLCQTDPGPASVNGNALVNPKTRGFFSQGCVPSSLYDPDSLQAVNTLATLGGSWGAIIGLLSGNANAGVTQDPNLRNIESALTPIYQAKTDVAMLNIAIDLSDSLTLTSLTSYSKDDYFTFQDYNRIVPPLPFTPLPPLTSPTGVFCDPQLGCSNLFRTFDRSSYYSSQWTQEIRIQSDFDGPLNFNIGGIWIDFETDPIDYWVFSNSLTAASLAAGLGAGFVDFNNPPTGLGHNYYLNRSIYELSAWAAMGEVYYEPIEGFTITGGLRYTSDTKDIQAFNPVLFSNDPNPDPELQHAEFNELTGRLGFDWDVDTGFSDQTLIYGFYSRGYKGGGFNPPSSEGIAGIKLTYDPEFVDAFELGIKNTLLDGDMILNATAFHYDYQGYQISKIVNRSSVNENIDATVRGAELEAVWEVFEGFRLNGTVGYLNTEITGGESIDTFDRAQGNPAWTLVKDPFTAQNCLFPTAALTPATVGLFNAVPAAMGGLCSGGGSPLIYPPTGANPFFPLTIEGIPVNLTGRELPNSPHWTYNIGAEYSWALGGSWSATARADYYWQGEAFTRIFNTPADRLEGYDNLNLLVRVASEDKGMGVELFVQNATDELAITDAYLTDDSSGLFRNIFLTEPRIFGMRVMKEF